MSHSSSNSSSSSRGIRRRTRRERRVEERRSRPTPSEDFLFHEKCRHRAGPGCWLRSASSFHGAVRVCGRCRGSEERMRRRRSGGRRVSTWSSFAFPRFGLGRYCGAAFCSETAVSSALELGEEKSSRNFFLTKEKLLRRSCGASSINRTCRT